MRLLIILLMLVSCGATPSTSSKSSVVESQKQVIPAKFSTAKIVATYPHDPKAFTQGLLFEDGKLYESTGEYGSSSLRRVDIATGKVEKKQDIERQYFCEGLALVGDELYQLTWREGRAFTYDLSTFKRKATNAISGEGWGLTANQGELYLSDGTSAIRVLDPKTWREKRRFTVHYERGELDMLNELEWIEGRLWANVFMSNLIAVIDPTDGRVEEFVDCSSVATKIENPEADAFNGIAYDSVARRVFVTGKNWEKLFEITR